MYSASGLLSLSLILAAPGALSFPQAASARTAISVSAVREFFMAVERAAAAVKNL